MRCYVVPFGAGGLGIIHRSELAAVLTAIDNVNGDIARAISMPEMASYRHGFETALLAVARAFGLSLVEDDTANASFTPANAVALRRMGW